ncbi:hypothetical protein MFU01_50840 [Myxococcus fulvus]|uniref:Uncharacterized protein n=1 Tax=Myxococcus fulvus TaxID=33 RepID=A0A511T7T3_MYXFU|nr:hypothetical protein MFU01_50840 [Myxococcus fulvus]
MSETLIRLAHLREGRSGSALGLMALLQSGQVPICDIYNFAKQGNGQDIGIVQDEHPGPRSGTRASLAAPSAPLRLAQ